VKVETKLPEVKAVFTKPGSVGMELKEDTGPQGTRAVSIVSLVPGTQADTHAELRPGLKVVAVAGQDVRGKSLDDVFDLIIGHPGRPLEFRFEDDGTAPNPPKPPPRPPQAAPEIIVTFTQQGSVGLDLREDPGPSVSIETVKAGTQAMQHAALKAGLKVTMIAGQDTRGKSLDDVFDLIIGHPERPLEFRFEGDGGAGGGMGDLADVDPMSSGSADADAAAAAAAAAAAQKKAARQKIAAEAAERKAALQAKLAEQKAIEQVEHEKLASRNAPAGAAAAGGIEVDASVEADVNQSVPVGEPEPATTAKDSTSGNDDEDEDLEDQFVVYYGGPFDGGDEHTWAYLPELKRLWAEGTVTGRTKVWRDTDEFGEKWKKLKVFAAE
jgi:RNAse (barnase) inhibitor barstar